MTELLAPSFAAAPVYPPQALRVGDVFRQSQRLFAAHWAAYSGLVLVAYIPLLALSATAGTGLAATRGQPSGFEVGALVAGGLLSFVVLMLAHAAIYVSVFQDAGGRGFSISQSLVAALRQAPAFIAVGLLIYLYAMLAMLLLVFPALIVLCVYYVAYPACVVERIGPIKSMRRSAFLTRGNRWRIFGIVIILTFGLGMLTQLIIYLAKLVGGPIFSLVVTLPIEGVAGGFSAVVMGVLYAQLRFAREGVDIEHIASVFD
jgi:uncharacterized membrane protein